jgi:hypothetical protein
MERDDASRSQEHPGSLTQSSSSPPLSPMAGVSLTGPTEEAAPGAPTLTRKPWLSHQSVRHIGSVIVATLVLVAALLVFRDGSGADPTNSAAERLPGTRSSFTTTGLDNGWTHYESADEGFSLDLPPGWGPFETGEYGPELRFSASESAPFASYGASFYVMKIDTNGYSDPATYFGFWRDYLSDMPNVVGEVGLTPTQLPAGQSYVVTSSHRSKSGQYTDTQYGFLHGAFAYRFVFVVRSEDLDEYEDVFHQIAMTFEFVD